MCAPGCSGAAAAERSPERSGNCVYTQSCTADIRSMEKRGEDYNIQVNEKYCNFEREYRDCRRDKIGITRHNIIMMHQVLYNTLFVGQPHI